MEKFKAVEKAMKTKAYSKEGLSAAAKLDPKERAKMEAAEFLGNMVDDLERQIETLEAEGESIQATMKKGKNQSSKADRMAEIERITERHKWHQGKLELIKRSLENGAVETEQVTDLEETIRYYVTDGMNEDFMEDDEMYDDLNLQEEEDSYGMNNENDRVSSQDTQSVQEEAPEPEPKSIPAKSKSAPATEAPNAAARRPSTQMKSPLPTLATLHTPLPTISNGTPNMKPAALPTRAPGETLKYASAAAAAAASEKSNMGIAPLPPPPEALPSSAAAHPSIPSLAARSVASASPKVTHAQPATSQARSAPAAAVAADASTAQTKSPALSHASAGASQPSNIEKAESSKPSASLGQASKAQAAPAPEAADSSKGLSITPERFMRLTDQTRSITSKRCKWYKYW
jgi:CCR4-NOT transcription complex subunit 3